MRRLILLALALVMAFSMVACGCEHPQTQTKLTDVDAEKLTAKLKTTCTECGKVLESQDTDTGIAPDDGLIRLSPQDWFSCLTTNITTYDSSGMLVPMGVTSEDNAQLYSVVSVTSMKSVMSFYDKEGNILTTDRAAEPDTIHQICIEGQFDNDTADEFYTLLMFMVMTNNSNWDSATINTLCQQIMSGETVTDNGYSYTMEILSPIYHTVAVSITAE